MAQSTPSIRRANFITPKKLGATRQLLNDNLQQQFQTPNKLSTPKRSIKTTSTANTPECFSSVSLETPNSAATKRKISKCDQESNLIVAVRVRPLNSRELAYVGACNVVRVKDQEIIIRSNSSTNSTMSLDHIFQYDHVFWSCDESSSLYSSQEDVFLTVGKPLLNSAFRGYNACLFAYGQTGSGKSFSMMGKNCSEIIDIDSEEYSGVTPRFCRDLFDRIEKLDKNCVASVEVSYFEIYNEKIHDLLANQSTNNKTALKVREHPVWGPYVVDLSVNTVKSYNELRNWLILGNKNRATAATTMNEKSSRSHSIFSIELCLTDGLKNEDSSRRSKVSLVDLAGSERLSTSQTNEELKRQGVSINKSLLTLGKVISALSEQKKNQFVPYRDSVLTWLLRESLGGNSLTSMLATISPANTHLDETLSTLRYACQARAIINRARINENPHDRLIRELRTEVERLKALRNDFERSSTLINNSSSLTQLNDDSNLNKEELDELRNKLNDAENKLLIAEKDWQQRFMETKQYQLKELLESEKRREELESKVRIMKTADNLINLSPYKSNFLEELENVLTTDLSEKLTENEIIQNTINWCTKKGLICTFNSNLFTFVDEINKKQSSASLDTVDSIRTYEEFCNFINNELLWTDLTMIKSSLVKKVNKNEILTTMNRIYECLNNLKPPESDNNLSLLFAKVNKSLQSFETALMNNVSKINATRSVTFNV